MAILSDYEEEQTETKPSPPPPSPSSSSAATPEFRSSFDASSPLGFFDKVFEFVAENSDFLEKASAEKEVLSAVRAATEKKKKKRKAADEAAAAEKAAAEKKKVVGETSKKVVGEPPKKDEKSPMEVEKKEEESGARAPNRGNGLDLENYSWTQSLQEVNVRVPVPAGTKSRSVVCEIKRNHIKLGLKGQSPIIEGELFRAVKPGDCYWSIEDQCAIDILLTKQEQMEWWKSLVKGDPEVDTSKIEPESSKLAELDAETRKTVEKMMFDQRQKTMGLPTSDDIQKEEIMKKFMSQHPEMDFSQAKIQ